MHTNDNNLIIQNIQAKKLELEESKLEKEKLHRAVLETITEAEEKERSYEHSRFYLESELALKTLQLSGVEVDVRSHVSVLTQRLEDAMGEKSVAEDALRKERQVAAELSREQTRKASELAQAQRYEMFGNTTCCTHVHISYMLLQMT